MNHISSNDNALGEAVGDHCSFNPQQPSEVRAMTPHPHLRTLVLGEHLSKVTQQVRGAARAGLPAWACEPSVTRLPNISQTVIGRNAAGDREREGEKSLENSEDWIINNEP